MIGPDEQSWAILNSAKRWRFGLAVSCAAANHGMAWTGGRARAPGGVTDLLVVQENDQLGLRGAPPDAPAARQHQEELSACSICYNRCAGAFRR